MPSSGSSRPGYRKENSHTGHTSSKATARASGRSEGGVLGEGRQWYEEEVSFVWMANQRFGESGPSSTQPLGYGIHHGISTTAANFFEQEGSGAYFGELEEALMQGVVGIRNDGDGKPAAAFDLAARPPTLDIFPSWPISFKHPSRRGNSQSADSTDSGSAHNTTTIQLDSDSPVNVKASSEQQQLEQKQFDMETDTSRIVVGAGGAAAQQPKPQEKQRRTADKILDPKTLRRLAQNREAARKSRLRKKAYVQQLESSRIKLTQLEQDLQRARSQGNFFGGAAGPGGNLSSGAAIFDMEYARWLEEDQKHMLELRGGLQAHLPDGELRLIIDDCLRHYDEIFRLKGIAAKSDVFHLITGMWTTPAERCFLWMGGFRPSELLKILMTQLDPLTEQQQVGIYSLQHSSQQAEEALSQGMEQLQQSLADTVASGSLSESGDVGGYMGQMAIALGKLSDLEGFVRQADNLRQETLHQMRRILTVRQAARCFLAIGEYHNRLRAVSSLWSSRPRESVIAEESAYPATTAVVAASAATTDMRLVPHPGHDHFSAF